MMKLNQIVRVTVVALAAALLVWALPTGAQSNVPQINMASVRVVNALVGLGPMDVYLDGTRVAYGLAPETATPYLTVAAGKHSLAVRPPNTDALSAPVADVVIDLAPNQSETAVVYQRQFAGDGFTPTYAQTGAFFVLDDDRSATDLGKVRLTAVHLAPGSPALLSLAYPSRESLLHEIALEKPYGTVDINAQIYSLALVDATSPDLTVLARLGDFSLYANMLYTAIIVPDMQPSFDRNNLPEVQSVVPTPRAFLVSAPLDPPPDGLRLRLIHAAPNTAVLDIYIDGRLVAERVNYSRATEYLGLKDYSHVIMLRAVGSAPDAAPLAQAQFNITADNRKQTHWSLVLLNAAGADTSAALPLAGSDETNPQKLINTSGGSLFMVLLPDNIAQTRRGYARVRLINAVNNIQPLRLLAAGVPPAPSPSGVLPSPTPPLSPGQPTPTPAPPQQLVQDVVFGAEANEVEVPAGLYPALQFIPGGTTNVLASLTDMQLVSGMVYTFVAMGSPIGNPPISIVWFTDYGTGLPLDRLYIGTITAVNANIRGTPSTAGGIMRQLPRGTEVDVLGRDLNGEWIRVRFLDPDTGLRREGWISATANIIQVTRLGVPVNVLALPRYVTPGG